MIDLVANILEYVPGTPQDYDMLKAYHYQTDAINPYTSIFKIRAKYPYTYDFPDPISIIVYKMPLPQLRGRNIATAGFFLKPATKSARMVLVNEHVRYIARVITHINYRRCGIAEKLITESLKSQTVSLIETLTPPPMRGHVFLKAGFEMVHVGSPVTSRHLLNTFRSLGLPEQVMDCPEIVHNRLASLTGEKAIHIEKEIRRFLSPFRHRNIQQPGLDRTKYIIRKLVSPSTYFHKAINKTPFLSKK